MLVLNFAHRGSLTEAPENTLPAMEKAIGHRPRAIELDVQLTKDNHLVVIHDHRFSRFNKNTLGLIQEYTLDEIKKIDVGSSFSPDYQGVPLATLEEVLEICPVEILLNVEIKNIPVIYEGIEEILLDTLRRYNRLENVLISSFDHLSLQKVQQLNPSLDLGLLLYYRILKPWEYAKRCGLDIFSVHPHVSYTDKQFIEEFHNLGCKVYPFTVNSLDDYHRLLKDGVDGVFSNNPEIFSAK